MARRGVLLLAALLAAACARPARKQALPRPAALPETAIAAEAPEADIRGPEFAAHPSLQSVHFEFDSYELGRESRETLKSNMDFLRDQAELELVVEGHCDERGTSEYNLALGQRRAQVVRAYYMRLGLPGRRIATLSYGEERPLCAEADEACWARNRRAETHVRAKAAVQK